MIQDAIGENGRFKRLFESRPGEPTSDGFECAPSVSGFLNTYRPGAYDELASLLVALLDVSRAYITLVGEHRFYVLAERGLHRFVYRRDQLPDDALVRRGTSCLVRTPGSDPGWEGERWGGTDREWLMWIGVPVTDHRDRLLGTVSAASCRQTDWTWNDVRCMNRVAEDVLNELTSTGRLSSPGP